MRRVISAAISEFVSCSSSFTIFSRLNYLIKDFRENTSWKSIYFFFSSRCFKRPSKWPSFQDFSCFQVNQFTEYR
ncbi:hypothetical protein Patl1_03484 [Pistacia atlantica]|uniref:Uncharacterized protein n=1 Tax=Pistacia atlantica TaxID=434234 RepID=A0ACC1C8P8_9ROSI|nr:hypothetical protein Patl1_03484 [Pistacia atlantica]